MEAPPLEFLRVVGSHVRELPEDVQVRGISCKNTQGEALVPILSLCFDASHPQRVLYRAVFTRNSSFSSGYQTQLYTQSEPSSVASEVLLCLSVLC